MKEYDIKRTAERIRTLRREHGLSQEKLAEAIHICPMSISRIERGVIGCSITSFVALSNLFSVSLDYLVFGEDDSHERLLFRIDAILDQLYDLVNENRRKDTALDSQLDVNCLEN